MVGWGPEVADETQKKIDEARQKLNRTPDGASLDEEIIAALKSVPKAHYQAIVAARFGVGDFATRHTLEELSGGNFWPDQRTRTRERARQVLMAQQKRIMNSRLSFTSFEKLATFVGSKPFWSEEVLGREIKKTGIECDGSVFRHISALTWMSGMSDFPIRRGLTPLLFRDSDSLKQFDKDIAEVRKQFRDRFMVPLAELKELPSFKEIDDEYLKILPFSLTLYRDSKSDLYVARNLSAFRSHASYLDTQLATIFSMTRSG